MLVATTLGGVPVEQHVQRLHRAAGGSDTDLTEEPSQSETFPFFDQALMVICGACATAWGIFTWVRIKRCRSEALFVLFGHNIPLTARGIQGFALFYWAFQGFITFSNSISQ